MHASFKYDVPLAICGLTKDITKDILSFCLNFLDIQEAVEEFKYV